MKILPLNRTTAAFERAQAAQQAPVPYELRLYVAGATTRSARTIATIKTACEKHLAGRYDLRIIDIYQQPQLARQEHIVAVPLLVKQAPAPRRRLVGDLSDRAQLLAGLDIPAGEAV